MSSTNVAPAGLSTHAYRPLTEDDIRRIHDASLTVLARTGVQVQPSEARDIFARAGARVDEANNRVYIPRSMVEDALSQASHRFTLAGRDPAHDMEMGGERVYMGTGGAAIKVMDLDGSVRESRLADIARIGRLVDALDNIHFYLRPVVPHDVPKALLDVNKTYTALANTTKHVMTSAYTVPSARDVLELAAMVAGGKAAYAQRPIVSFTACWTVSPLRYAPETVEVLIELVRQNAPVVISSAPQSGATSPAALAGTLVQINAEELSGIVLCNLVRPGARMLMGYVPSVADMRTGNFVGGGPEFALMNAAATQLAHFYNLPIYNSSGLSDSKLPDIQAGYEKGITSAAAALAGTNFVHHSAGFLESMLCVAYEQYVIDDDINGSVMRMVRGIEVTDETLSVDVIDEVCRGSGHYLTTQQSLDLMRREYYYPHTADRARRDEWQAKGGLDMRARAQRARSRNPDDAPARTHRPRCRRRDSPPVRYRVAARPRGPA
ncbi:MAG: trimethylamine methyltransferase family protein [Anaerolineae bacterium]|nr:trimethylamine methyltransferase family protein [Anaerolineae bacterium]